MVTRQRQLSYDEFGLSTVFFDVRKNISVFFSFNSVFRQNNLVDDIYFFRKNKRYSLQKVHNFYT